MVWVIDHIKFLFHCLGFIIEEANKVWDKFKYCLNFAWALHPVQNVKDI